MTEFISKDTKIVFGTSGWRGRLGQDFVLDNLRRATQGVVKYYNHHIKQGSILIGFDPRRGNHKFATEIASILAANNIPVRIIHDEPTPTPVLSYLANSDKEIIGVINLTASHNKYTNDGLKFSPYYGGVADEEMTNLISKYANEATAYKKVSYETAKKEGLVRGISLS